MWERIKHSFETRPDQVIGSWVRWVDPGWPGSTKKKQLFCSWCLITRIIGGSKFAIVIGYLSCPVRHSFLNQSMSNYYRISTCYYPSCYKIWQYINLSSRSWEEYIYIYIYQLVIDIGDARRPSYFYWVILLPQASLLISKIC